jgi:hypothetical protein
MNKTRWGITALLCAGALLVNAGIAAAQSCRIPQRFPGATAASMDFKADLNANLGDWGTIFMDVDTDGCEVTARDFLQSKLERQNLDANGWKGGLRGGDVYLVTAAALRLGGRGLLTSAIHNEVLQALASYDFANWGGTCARGAGNGCMDDYTVAAAGHAWAGAYLSITHSTISQPARDAAWFLAEARRYIKLSLSPQDTLCVRAVTPTASACKACLNDYNTGYQDNGDPTALRNDIYNNKKEVLSFEHGFENPNYGIGLLTSLSIAFQGLQVATGTPYVPSYYEKVMAHGIFRTGQRHAPKTTNVCQTAWLNNCVGLECSIVGNCISGTCLPPPYGCGENFGGVAYDAGMYPVKALLQNELALPAGRTLIFGSPYYQFDQFSGLCSPSKFSPTAPFFHDGRYAAYYRLSSEWAYGTQPPLGGVKLTVTGTGSPSSSPYGATLTWTATASGGTPSTTQYALFRRLAGTPSWIPDVTAPAWQSSNVLSWTPTSADTGTWEIIIWVKDGNTPPTMNTYGFAAYYNAGPVQVTTPAPLTVTGTGSPSTSPWGTTLTWTATTSGGVPSTVQYALFRRLAGTPNWIPDVTAPAWQTSNVLSWIPTSADIGTWEIIIWVKDVNTSPTQNTYGFAAYYNAGPVQVN